MATAIDSTGVRVDGEENGENERAGERTTADGRRPTWRTRLFGGVRERKRRDIRDEGGQGREKDRKGARERPRRGCEGKRVHRLGQDPGAGGEYSVEIDRGHGVTMVVLHGTPFIRYNAG